MKRGAFGSKREEARLSAMSLDELEAEIRRCRYGAEHGGTAAGRKSYLKRLIWVESLRESIHGIEAPRRRV